MIWAASGFSDGKCWPAITNAATGIEIVHFPPLGITLHMIVMIVAAKVKN